MFFCGCSLCQPQLETYFSAFVFVSSKKMQSCSYQIDKFMFLPNKYQLNIYQMLNVTEHTTLPDLDQNQYLNGMGSVVIIPNKPKKPSSNSYKTAGRTTLITHIKKHITAYLILFALLVTAFVVVRIEKEYQSTLDQTIAQNKQLKEILKETGKTSKTVGYKDDNKITSSPLQSSNNEGNKSNQLTPFPEPGKSKQPPVQAAQYNKVDNNKEHPKPTLQQLINQQFKAITPTEQISSPPKTNGQIQKNTIKDSPKIVDNKPNIPQKQTPKTPPIPPRQPPPRQTSKAPPKQTPAQQGRPIAGVSQDQRIKAQKWLGLKNEDIYEDTAMAKQERKYYEEKYNISTYPQLPICVVIPSHNNVKNNLHIKNIKSVIMQEYTNYHIVFIDDASTDGTGNQIQKFLTEQNKVPKDRYIIIKNKEQKRAMPNLRRAARQFCKPEDIFIIVDGDDQLLGRQVLKLYSAVFQKNKAWFVYSNFLSIRGTVGYSRPFPQSTINGNKYRSYPFVTSHLRAFYTQLFLNIKEDDLKDESGEYLKAANDVAICIPILEMSHERVFYLPELTYYYNSNTGQNNHQVRLKQQKSNDRMLRKRKSYARLQQLKPVIEPVSKQSTTETVQISPQKEIDKQKEADKQKEVGKQKEVDKQKSASQVQTNKNNQ